MIDARAKSRAPLLVLALIGAWSARGADEAAAKIQFSEAERILWTTDQLHMVKIPLRIEYAFEKSGSYEKGFTDRIELDIVKVHPDGTKNARVTFFTGERNHFVPESEATDVNPVLGVYMQGDTYEMGRLTGNNDRWRYFHRRVKFAFAEGATVSDVKVEFDGRKVAARQVHIRPYADDPHRSEMLQFADKEYWITISDAVPAYLYEIRTRVPGRRLEGKSDPPPLIEERLRLTQVKPLPAPKSKP
jgi:hypothetical protein